ncbi:MAG: hypothetical protein R2771_07410 [Saprospiraceae bacterium]
MTASDGCGNTLEYTYNLAIKHTTYCTKPRFFTNEVELIPIPIEEMYTSNSSYDYSFSDTDPNVDTTYYGCDKVGIYSNRCLLI